MNSLLLPLGKRVFVQTFFGATSEYPATHALLNLLLPWSAVRSRLYVLSVKLKCYRGLQSRSR